MKLGQIFSDLYFTDIYWKRASCLQEQFLYLRHSLFACVTLCSHKKAFYGNSYTFQQENLANFFFFGKRGKKKKKI